MYTVCMSSGCNGFGTMCSRMVLQRGGPTGAMAVETEKVQVAPA